MTSDERTKLIFEASVGCTGAAVESLRAQNRPINATYIAQTAWEIAKKLEEMLEVNVAKQGGSAPLSVTVAPRAAAAQVEEPILELK